MESTSPPKTWSVDEVVKFMEKSELAEHADVFKKHVSKVTFWSLGLKHVLCWQYYQPYSCKAWKVFILLMLSTCVYHLLGLANRFREPIFGRTAPFLFHKTAVWYFQDGKQKKENGGEGDDALMIISLLPSHHYQCFSDRWLWRYISCTAVMKVCEKPRIESNWRYTWFRDLTWREVV